VFVDSEEHAYRRTFDALIAAMPTLAIAIASGSGELQSQDSAGQRLIL
jgi:hypothetical protein